MSRLPPYLIGPELLWLAFYALVVLLIEITGSPVKGMDDHWVNLAYIVPLVCVPLTFALYYVPGVERNWLLLRVLIAGLFGAHFVLEKGMKAPSEQGPGVGTAYLIIGSIFVKIRF